jgi:hypothetical protein
MFSFLPLRNVSVSFVRLAQKTARLPRPTIGKTTQTARPSREKTVQMRSKEVSLTLQKVKWFSKEKLIGSNCEFVLSKQCSVL